ncbi:MAG: site-specific integrase, partial [Chloroflexota bacterium]|nr:site-specific integrase [Chloroflexota bacterium]
VPAWGTFKVRELRPGQIESYLNQKVRDGQLSAMSARHIRGILRAALNWAIAEGHVSRNVAALAKAPKVARRDVEPFTPEEVDAILRALAGDRLEGLYITEVALGLRPAELLGLAWQNVDLDGAFAHVRNTLQYIDGEYRLTPSAKTLDSQAAMPLPEFVIEVLQEHLERQDKEQAKLEKYHQPLGNEWDLVFTAEDGRPLHQSTIYHHFQRLLRRIGIRPRSFYTLRHTSASLLIEDGAELRDVMEHLRHSQISLTANTYTHLYQSRKRATAERMDTRLRRTKAAAMIQAS